VRMSAVSALASDLICVDRSFQTDARAQHARPEAGIASDASVS
jgi:hypothetical protein